MRSKLLTLFFLCSTLVLCESAVAQGNQVSDDVAISAVANRLSKMSAQSEVNTKIFIQHLRLANNDLAEIDAVYAAVLRYRDVVNPLIEAVQNDIINNGVDRTSEAWRAICLARKAQALAAARQFNRDLPVKAQEAILAQKINMGRGNN